MSKAYYNEIDPYAAQWLRNLIAAGHIAPGDVDTRSIVDVKPDDLIGYTQCHFFAGIAGWSRAARLAGWPDDRELWTGSCPCQPFSVAGKGEGQTDERHLWPYYRDLIAAVRPAVAMGEQVAAAVGKDWLDGVSSDMEGLGYSCRAAVVPACAIDAPHRRDRLWFVADCAELLSDGCGDYTRGGAEGSPETAEPRVRGGRHVADPVCSGWSERRSLTGTGPVARDGSSFSEYQWALGADGKARRVKPGVRLLAHGVPARVGKLRAYGNAIVPQVAEQVIRAYMLA